MQREPGIGVPEVVSYGPDGHTPFERRAGEVVAQGVHPVRPGRLDACRL